MTIDFIPTAYTWTVDSGHCGQWTVDRGLWMWMDSGLWTNLTSKCQVSTNQQLIISTWIYSVTVSHDNNINVEKHLRNKTACCAPFCCSFCCILI